MRGHGDITEKAEGVMTRRWPSAHQTRRFVAVNVIQCFCVALILAECFIYDVVVFDYRDFLGEFGFLIVSMLKLGIPLLLCVSVGLPNLNRIARDYWSVRYLSFFILFVLWLVFPCLYSSSAVVSIEAWSRYLPRLVFFISVLALFLRFPAAFAVVSKIFVAWAVLMVFQFLVLNLTKGYESGFELPGLDAHLAGPLGLLGNISSIMSLPGVPFPIMRLCGFWKEPSIASAFMFASFFLARSIAAAGASRLWRHASWCCLFGGFACLSNAGYLALGVGAAFGIIVSGRRTPWMALRWVLILPVAVILILGAFVGRMYVTENMPDSATARAFFGVREFHDSDPDSYDFSGGRLDLLHSAVDTVLANPQGIGMSIQVSETGYSASAPVLWMLVGGIPGLLLLLARETQIVFAAIHRCRSDPVLLAVTQAWLAVLAQQLSYGSWNDPTYLVLSAGVLAARARPVCGRS